MRVRKKSTTGLKSEGGKGETPNLEIRRETRTGLLSGV